VIKIRVFFAIEFEEDFKKYLWDIQQIIKQNSLKGNFTRQDNFHLTLKFIGEVEPAEIENLKKAIDVVTVNRVSFSLVTSELGQFPRRNKKIIWLGLEESTALQQLHSDLENFLEKQGYEKEKRSYTPHITLGREVVLNCDFQELQRVVKIETQEIPVQKVSLMESTRVEGKLTYISVYSRHFT
jgi:2'-5' RNA ligase